MAAYGIATIAGERETAGGRGAADWLCLAAAPTFAAMALLTGMRGGGPLDMLCAAAQHASPLSGMVPMYVLMTAFHSGPWLKLVAGATRADRVRVSPIPAPRRDR